MESKKINQLATEMSPAATDLTIIGDPITGVSKKITLEQIASLFAGSVSFYANLAAFPVTGTIDTIYCAKDTNKLYLWSGSAYVQTFPSQALLDTYQLRSEKGASNGYASLDSAGKVPVSQLPSSIMEYKGMWSAATNTPTLANGTGDTGDVYICNAAGSVNFGAGAITFAVGDYVIYSGSIWQRSSGAVGTVTSVGLSTNGNSVTIGSSPVTTSGTISANFVGDSTQYINGAGNLTTFPTLLSSDNLVKLVRNQSGATITAGTVIYISGATGNKPLISKALATGDATSAQTYGLLQTDIANNADGYVVVIGNVNNLDTSAFTEGQQLYLSGTTAGTYTSTKPYAPIHLVYVGIVLRAHPTMGIIGVKIQNGYEMDELHNVAAQSPNNGDILQYVTSTNLWTKTAGTTTNISEGTNLYYTDSRARLALGAGAGISYNSTTGVITSTITQYTDALARAALSFVAGSGAYNSTTGVITIPTNNNQITNGANYITLLSLSSSATGLTYTNTTGVFSLTAGYSIPTTANQTNWTTAYNDSIVSAAVTGTTTKTLTLTQQDAGTITASWTDINTDAVSSVFGRTGAVVAASGDYTTAQVTEVTNLYYTEARVNANTNVAANTAARHNAVTIGTANGLSLSTQALSLALASTSATGALSSTDWNTFNNKQSALTNPVTGTGNNNYIPKFTSTGSTIGDSTLQTDSSGNLGIGLAPSAWTTSVKALQIGGGSMYATTTYNFIGNNVLYSSTGDKYINAGYATAYGQTSGEHRWYIAPSGVTAGDAITFTRPMTINTSGNVIIGTEVSTNHKLTVYNATSAAQVRVAGAAPSVVFTDTITDPANYVAYFGMATAVNNFMTGTAAGDYIFHNYSGGPILFGINNSIKVSISSGGIVKIADLAGTGNRMVIVDSTGTLSTQAITTGTVTSVGLSSATSGVTIGSTPVTTSGTITIAIATATTSQNGLLSSTDWTIFNGKQAAINGTGFVKASGTTISYDNSTYLTTTSAASTYLPLAGGILTGDLSGTSASFSNTISGYQLIANSVNDGSAIFAKRTGGVNTFALNTNANSSFTLYDHASGSYTAGITQSSGNVGIGVAPSYALDIYKSSASLRIYNTSNPSALATYSKDLGLILTSYYSASASPYTRTADIVSNADAAAESQMRFFTAIAGSNPAVALTLAPTGAATFSSSIKAVSGLLQSATTDAVVDILNLYNPSQTSSGVRQKFANGYGDLAAIKVSQRDNGALADDGQIEFQVASNSTLATRLSILNTGAVTINSTTYIPFILNSSYGQIGLEFQLGGTGFASIGSASNVTGAYTGSETDLGLGTNASATANIIFATGSGSTRRMVITSGGNVGIGTDSPYSNARFQVKTATNINIAYQTGTLDATGIKLNAFNDAGSANIPLEINASILYFKTAETQKMSITNSGNLLIGNGATDVGSLIHAYTTENRDNMVYTNTNANLTYALFAAKTTRAGGTSCYFYYGEANSVTTYRVYNNGNVQNTNNSYGAISDISLKTNIFDATPKLSDLLKVRIVNYNLKGSEDKQIGVIAQELEKIFPNMIDIDGNTKLKSVKYSVFVPMLIKAVQELKAEIEILKNK
jgi:hypothetical protein